MIVDIRLRERLIGALVLVTLVVLLVPAVLTGRAPVREAAPEPESAGLEIVLDATPAPALEQPVPEPELPAAPEPASTPAESPAVPASLAAAPAAVAPAGAPPAFAVQLGAFKTRDRADQWVSELREQGYSAFVFEYRAGGQILYRVRVGPESDRSRAQALADRLRKAGHTAVVAPHP